MSGGHANPAFTPIYGSFDDGLPEQRSRSNSMPSDTFKLKVLELSQRKLLQKAGKIHPAHSDGAAGPSQGDTEKLAAKPKKTVVKGGKMKQFYRRHRLKLKASFKRVGSLLFLMMVTFIGGAIFQKCEVDNEQLLFAERTRKVDKFTKTMCDALGNKDSMCQSKVLDVLEDHETVDKESLYEVIVMHGVSSNDTRWTLWESSFLSLTAYTTIGYGFLTPTTSNGQVAIVIYSTLVIPLFLYIIADIGVVLNKGMRHLWARISFLWGKVSKSHSELLSKEYTSAKSFVKKTRKEPIPMMIAVITTYLYLFIGGVLFYLLEDWSYFESFYYCFQSLCTIGFGDIFPRRGNRTLTTAVSTVYIIFGLAMVSMCFNALSEHIKKNYEQMVPQLWNSTIQNIRGLPSTVNFTQKDIVEILQRMSSKKPDADGEEDVANDVLTPTDTEAGIEKIETVSEKTRKY